MKYSRLTKGNEFSDLFKSVKGFSSLNEQLKGLNTHNTSTECPYLHHILINIPKQF